jgi:hypothetical protein
MTSSEVPKAFPWSNMLLSCPELVSQEKGSGELSRWTRLVMILTTRHRGVLIGLEAQSCLRTDGLHVQLNHTMEGIANVFF